MKFFAFSFLLIQSTITYAQQSPAIIGYFDKNWLPETDIEAAYYYRTVEQKDGKFLVKDYFKSSNKLQKEAWCVSVEPELVREGKATWYHENGKLKIEAFYVNNQRTGEERAFYEDGTPQELILHRGEKSLYCQHWSKEGKPLLDHGTGRIIGSNEVTLNHLEIKDSLLIGVYSVTPDKQDTVFTMVETSAEYRGGYKTFFNEVGAALRYPKLARKQGIEGRVFVQFIIDKQGKLTKPTVIRGIGGGCDAAAVEAIRKPKKWIPAKFRGRSVNQRMVLPVNFKLS